MRQIMTPCADTTTTCEARSPFSAKPEGRVGTPSRAVRFPRMTDREYIENLIEVVEELKHRLLKQCDVIEGLTGDELLEEKALLRNLVMQLDGLKLRLRKARLH